MITVIGDVHGMYDKHYEIASKVPFSVQIGDFGSNLAYNSLYYSDLLINNHKIVGGNHEDYDSYKRSPHALGDFGPANLGGKDFFFVRGGISFNRTDKRLAHMNGRPQTYWSNEELNFNQMIDCLNLYKNTAPKTVLTHVPPSLINDIFYKDNNQRFLIQNGFAKDFIENTALLCQKMYEAHQPEIWVFGHHHKSLNMTIGQTKFIGLDELEAVEI